MNRKITDSTLSEAELKVKSKVRTYKMAKRFSEWFLKKWWFICVIVNLYDVVNIIVMKINAAKFNLQILHDISSIIAYALLLGVSLLFASAVVAGNIVDKFEGDE